MADFSYNIFVKPKNLTGFMAGSNWLIGITAEKRDKLIARLKPLAETGNIDSQKIETTIAEFIEWFIDDYEKREKKECPYDENEIVESVGIISLNQSGQYVLYTYGKFRFYHTINNQPISAADNKGQLAEYEMLIANPKNASINESILAIENTSDTDDDTLKYQDFSYPFAIIRPENERIRIEPTSSAPKKSYWQVAVLLLILSTIGVLSWLNKNVISHYITGLLTDSTSVVQPAPNETVAPIPKEMSTSDYFEKAEQSFDFAKSFMEDGKNARALQQLDSAEFYYQKVVKSDPSYKAKIQGKMFEITTRKSVLNGEMEMVADTTKR